MPTPDPRRWYGDLPDARVRRIFDRLSESIDPRSDLEYASPFELLVAVVLSAQTTDQAVNKGTRRLFPLANTPQALVELGEEGLKPFIRHIGLFNNKAKNVIALSRLLLERHDGAVPCERAALEALPGVGRKTASVVLNVAFGEPTIAVDTHVHRVANRLHIADSRTPDQTELVLLARTPRKHLRHAHHYLILHGRYTCVARSPRCEDCPIRRWCPSANDQS